MATPVKELADFTDLVEWLKDNEVIAEVRIIKKKKIVFNAKFTPELLNLLGKLRQFGTKLPF